MFLFCFFQVSVAAVLCHVMSREQSTGVESIDCSKGNLNRAPTTADGGKQAKRWMYQVGSSQDFGGAVTECEGEVGLCLISIIVIKYSFWETLSRSALSHSLKSPPEVLVSIHINCTRKQKTL